MKLNAELGQLLCWNKSVQSFEMGEWARQQPWQPSHCLILSCSLPLQGTTVVVLRCHCIPLWIGLAFLFAVLTQTSLCLPSSLSSTDSSVCAYLVTWCQSLRFQIPPPSPAVPTCRWDYKNDRKVFQELLLGLSLTSEEDSQHSVKHMPLTMMPTMVSSSAGILQKDRMRM